MLDADRFEKLADMFDHEIARQVLQEFEPCVQLAVLRNGCVRRGRSAVMSGPPANC